MTVVDSQAVSPVAVSVDGLVALRVQAMAMMRRRQKRVKDSITGPSASKALGRGLDFSEVRSYQAGDDIRMIDWNVTARTGTAHTKLFVEEREQPFFLVVDFRNNMRFATRGMFKCVMAARLAAILGWCAVASNDRVGGLVFTDHWHSEIKPQSGRRGLMALFRAIEYAQSQVGDSADAEIPLLDQLKRLRRLAHAGSEVCILSDFNGFNEQCRSPIAMLQQHVELSSISIADPLEQSLPPPATYPMARAGHRFSLNARSEKKRRQYEMKFNQNIEQLERWVGAGKARYYQVSTVMSLESAAQQINRRSAVAS